MSILSCRLQSLYSQHHLTLREMENGWFCSVRIYNLMSQRTIKLSKTIQWRRLQYGAFSLLQDGWERACEVERNIRCDLCSGNSPVLKYCCLRLFKDSRIRRKRRKDKNLIGQGKLQRPMENTHRERREGEANYN